jgi:hypothetical protein
MRGDKPPRYYALRATFDVLLDSPEIVDPLGKSPARKPGGFEEHIVRIKKIHHIL